MHAQITQHAGIDFAGERAVIVLAHVLAAHFDEAVLKLGGYGVQRGVRRAHDYVHIGLRAEVTIEGFHQVRGFSHGFVHLPVAGDDQFAFFVHGKIICRTARIRRGVPCLQEIPDSHLHRCS